VLLDVRWTLTGPPARELYEAGHIPGAHFVDLETDLASAPGDGGRHPLPDVSVFEAAMRRCGVSGESDVVAYGASAARAWWLLRWTGHRAVRVLDGGLDAWIAAGGAVTTEDPPAGRGDFTARPGAMPVLDAEAAARLAREGGLLDVRDPERYRGEVEPVDPVAGHIPGAVNAPAAGNLGPGGRLLAAEDLRRRFRGLGDGPFGAYCGSGVVAAQTVLALERAGLAGALYAGSWSEWIRDPSRPVEGG
jgi:thiosulfate/3-mercaptopyruvate sulfurtransferase